jgi:agmatine deiminase
MQTPAALGYRFPAEWEPHAATWLSWPHNPDTWPGKFEPIPAVWEELVRTLAEFEPVHILAGGDSVMADAQRRVGHLTNVTLHDVPTNDCWARDHGAMFLAAPLGVEPALIDWGYNAWGGKYPPFDLDDQVPRYVAEFTQRRRFEPGIILEGGAIDVNGLGTVLTTEQCLLNVNRNPQLTRPEVERYLREYLNVKKILWLGGGIVGDDTDGHIDELARFVGPRTVVAAVEDDPTDANFAPLSENLERLRSFTDQDDQPLEIVTLPMPMPKFFGEHRLPACYLNFYVANGVVIVPTFNDPADAVALATLGKLFPTRQIRGIHALDLIWGLGAFHCITQQQPY